MIILIKFKRTDENNNSLINTLHLRSSQGGNFIKYPYKDSFSNNTPIQYGEETDVDDL